MLKIIHKFTLHELPLCQFGQTIHISVDLIHERTCAFIILNDQYYEASDHKSIFSQLQKVEKINLEHSLFCNGHSFNNIALIDRFMIHNYQIWSIKKILLANKYKYIFLYTFLADNEHMLTCIT